MKTNLTHSPTTSLLVTLAESDTANNNTQWVHVLPLGEFSAVDGRGPFVVNDPEKILKTTLGRAGSRKIPVDYDHQIGKTEINGQPGIAAGWFSEFEVRDNGIWGLVEWTDKAKAHLDAKEYRYLSPSKRWVRLMATGVRLQSGFRFDQLRGGAYRDDDVKKR